MEDHPVRRVAEIHAPQAHFPPDAGQLPGVFHVRGLLLGVQELEDPLRRRETGVNFIGDVGDLVDGPGEFPGVEDKGGDLPQVDLPAQVQHRAQSAHQGEPQVVDEVDAGPHPAAHGVGVVEGVGRALVDLPEGIADLVLLGVALDGPVAGELLLHKAVHPPVGGGALGEEGPGDLVHVPGVADGQGDGDEGNGREGGADIGHHGEGPGHRHHAGENLHDVRRDAGADDVDVVGHAADDVAGLVLVKVADRHLHELVEHVAPELFGDKPPGAHHADVHREGQEGGADVAEEHLPRIGVDQGEVHVPLPRRRGADGLARQLGAQQAQHVPDDDQHHNNRQGQPVLHHVGQDPPQGPPRVLWFLFFCR